MQTYVLLAEGFEEIEALAVVDVLRRAKIETLTVSIQGKQQVTGAHGIAVIADKIFEDTDFSKGTMIVLPGGGPGTQNLQNHAGVAKVLQDYAAQQKWIAAICAAPSVLGKLGLLEGKSATCYPGVEQELIGARVTSANVVMDGRYITSRGPGTALEFALKLVEILTTRETANQLKESMLV